MRVEREDLDDLTALLWEMTWVARGQGVEAAFQPSQDAPRVSVRAVAPKDGLLEVWVGEEPLWCWEVFPCLGGYHGIRQVFRDGTRTRHSEHRVLGEAVERMLTLAFEAL